MHYCGGNLASLNLFESASCCCDSEKEISKNVNDDCCKDEIKSFKITDDQLQSKYGYKFLPLKIVNHLPIVFSDKYKFTQLKNTFYKSSIPRPPDDLFLIPIYKKVHSFIFYS